MVSTGKVELNDVKKRTGLKLPLPLNPFTKKRNGGGNRGGCKLHDVKARVENDSPPPYQVKFPMMGQGVSLSE